jgi:uncharacterized membrane protein
MKTKTALIVVLMFVVALAAGAVAGKLASRQQRTPAVVTGSELTDQLQLTPEQRNKMRPIWESVRDTADSCRKDAEAAQKEQQDQLVAMLNDDQRRKYADLTSATSIKIQVLDEKRKAAVRQAIEQTARLLSDDQRKAYRQLIKDRLGPPPDQSSQAPPLLEPERRGWLPETD